MTTNHSSSKPALGVLGGMGPLATVDFLRKLIEETPAALTIDVVTLTIGDNAVTEGGTLTFSLSLSAASQQDIVVTLNTGGGNATEGSDYTSIDGRLVTFAAGSTTASVTVVSIDDTTDEGTETFTVSATGDASQVVTTDTGTGTIYENDLPPSQVLDGAIVTNTNNVGQAGILTFVQSSYVLNAYAQYMLFTQQGNSQSFFADVGWNIDASRNYEVGFEHAGGDATNIGIKSFQDQASQ